MKKYKKPEIKIVKFEVEDVIASSGFFANIDGGIAKFLDSWLNTGADGSSTNFNENGEQW